MHSAVTTQGLVPWILVFIDSVSGKDWFLELVIYHVIRSMEGIHWLLTLHLLSLACFNVIGITLGKSSFTIGVLDGHVGLNDHVLNDTLVQYLTQEVGGSYLL
eukprot:m.287781 g.287781  ORF g.287781 m.287781 type:complete len:103 (-) comp17790_c0_seq10:6064-6372(-)